MLSSRPISFNGDVDVPQSILNAKTPGRKALKGRTALQENALYAGAKTVLSKKNILQTPFRPGTAHGKKPLVSISVTRPLTDKTPFPNRVVAAANFGGAGPAGKTSGTKLSKLALLVSEPQQESLSPDVAPLLRPSSARKSLRGRLSGGNFKTPLTKGNYWDVSPGDMEGIGGVAEDAKEEEETEVAVDDEDDEIEYMAPTAVELPYEPPFEIPDYKAMGQALFALGHGGLMHDAADAYYAMDIEEQVDIKQLIADAGLNPDPRGDDGLQLPELEDDSPFARKPKTAAAPAVSQPQAQPSSRPPTSKSVPSIPLTRASSIRAQATAPVARPATTTPPQNQSRPASASSASASSRVPLPRPTIAVAPGQTRTSALRAAKAAAAASASAGAGTPASKPMPKPEHKPKSNSGIAIRPIASAAPSSNTTNMNAATMVAGTGMGTRSKTKTQAQAPAPAPAPVPAKVQAPAQNEARLIPTARSVTSGAIPANANVNANVRAGTGTSTSLASASAGTGTDARTAARGVSLPRSRAASVNGTTTRTLGKASPSASGAKVKGTGARGGKADEDKDEDEDELAAALEKAQAAVGEDFVFEV